MNIEQIYTGCLAQGAYYIESKGEVAIIDPLREVQPYIDRAAKDKATYLLESVDEKIGKDISVIEINGNSIPSWRPQNYLSNTRMAAESSELSSDKMRKIKLRYEIKIRFEIN